uniref:Uncharacterized protein n=1 Tax=viral metagenome TaxID=1070528 RepID=A0A6C0AKJ7_9ZZZZ
MEEDGVIATVAIAAVLAVALACTCCSYFERRVVEEEYEISA